MPSLAFAATLIALWLLLSGYFSTMLLTLGALSVAIVLLCDARMYGSRPVMGPLKLAPTVDYLVWLFREVAISGWDVARRVLDPDLPVSPRVDWIHASQRSPLGRAVYANSITLTPGTVSMDLEGDWVLVHALSSEGIDSLLDGEMDRRVSRLEVLADEPGTAPPARVRAAADPQAPAGPDAGSASGQREG